MNCFRYLLIVFATCLATTFCVAEELPRTAQDLVDKLEEFEKAETEKLESLLAEKRKAVMNILQEQAQDETRKGNLDGAIAIREKIVDLGGQSETTEMPIATSQPAASWEVPDDAILLRGDYYKVYPLAKTISWEEARARCQAVGGELGWLDREEDDDKLRQWMQPLVNAKGHAPIWMGGRRDDAGEWSWVTGEPVDKEFWRADTQANASNNTAMIRWIGGLSGTAPDTGREIIGYLCRWKQ